MDHFEHVYFINTIHPRYINTLTAVAIFRKLAKKRQVDFFYMGENEITRCLVPWKGTQSTSYLVVGCQRVN